MIDDDIVREVREAREAFAASHGYDIRAMVAALHELGVASGREVVSFAPRPASTGPSQAQQPTGAIQVTHDSKSVETAAADEL